MRKIPFLLVCLLIACSGSTEDALILQSAKIHEETLTVSKEVVEKIKSLNIVLGNLQTDQTLIKDSLTVLKQDFIDWESTVIGIPGYEYDHQDHSGHNHDHSHKPPPDLTPEMMLEIQKSLREQVVKLNGRVQKIVNELENIIENETPKKK